MLFSRKLKFFLTRLQNASLPELIYRAREFIFISRLRARYKRDAVFINDINISTDCVQKLHLPIIAIQVKDSLFQSLLNGEIFTLNGDKKDIIAFEEQTRAQFSRDIPIHQGTPDIRMVWEPARLQHLTILLKYIQDYNCQIVPGDFRGTNIFATYTFPDPRPAEGIGELKEIFSLKEFVRKALLEWLTKNPFLFGPHYLSAMECGLRIPVFFYALKILDNLDLEERRLTLKAIYQHAWWIYRRLSLYSSLGNHTICECLGLVFAGAVFSSVPKGSAWLHRAIQLLDQELFHQILEDGGPLEQSFNYHRFVMDIYWLVIDFLEKNRLHDCTPWKPRLLAGKNFLQSFSDKGNLPAIGDSDDGYVLAPGIRTSRGLKVKRGPQELLAGSKEKGTEQAEDLVCKNEPTIWKKVKNQFSFETFPAAGYTVIRGNGLLFSFDHGLLGMPPLYNHGHADALSITLAVNGKAILVDPGTYQYNGTPEFRRYFKSTRAHNTVTIDGLDQAVQETSFIWSRPYRARLEHSFQIDGTIILTGSHFGYTRLANPVKHYRTISFSGSRFLLIRDTFSGSGNHDFELNYHFHPEAAIETKREWWVITYGEETVFAKLLVGGDFNLIKGQEEPLLGWFSPAYGVRVKNSVLHCQQKADARDMNFLTAIYVNCPGEGEFPKN